MSHTVGAHSDDRGGDSDLPCHCDDKSSPKNANEAQALISRALAFATTAHKDQSRDDGAPYITHPIQVANLVRQVTTDADLIAAAYLHDVVEDTDVTYYQLKAAFGGRIADLVMEVTHEGDDTRGYYFPRLKSREGILLKFADRLSNLSGMDGWAERRRAHYMKKSKFWKSEA